MEIWSRVLRLLLIFNVHLFYVSFITNYFSYCNVQVLFLQEFNLNGDEKPEKPDPEEYKLAKWMKKNIPTKKTKFLNHNVEYFTGEFVLLISFIRNLVNSK